jgi:hypothetical protein
MHDALFLAALLMTGFPALADNDVVVATGDKE